MKLPKMCWVMFSFVTLSFISVSAIAKVNVIDMAQKTAENQIRRLIEPLLESKCREDCKLMSVSVEVDLATPDEIAPGFDMIDTKATVEPTKAKVKLLINEKVGPAHRNTLLTFLQQYLDNLDYPVKIETQLARFPEPVETVNKVAELREKAAKQFKTTLEDLFEKYCPGHCLLADFNIQTAPVSVEEATYGSPGEFVQENGVVIKIKDISSTILVDDTLTPVERNSILEMAKLRTNYFKNVTLTAKALTFPKPTSVATADPLTGRPITNRSPAAYGMYGTDQKSTNSTNTTTSLTEKNQANTNSNSTMSNNTTNNNQSMENSSRQERFERIEKIERVENGDAVQAELQKFKVYGLIFGCSILSLLVFLAVASYHPPKIASPIPAVQKIIHSMASDPVSNSAPSTYKPESDQGLGSSGRNSNTAQLAVLRYEIEFLIEELMKVFATQPKVAKQVFSRIITEEGVEVTAQYIHIFGETIVIDMLRDPSLQSDITELMEYYAKTPIEINDEEKLQLLRALHNRTIAGKLVVIGNRSSNLFDFLAEMDGLQILELIRNESLTVKSIVLTQCDPQKRALIYSKLDDDVRMKLLTELSRIDHLPRDYIFNVSNALKRKRIENPRLNTDSLPGSEVLVSLLERTGPSMQREVVKNLEVANPESARTIKSKLVSIDTLRYLRDGQLLEVVLSLKHDELLQFLKAAPNHIRNTIFAKSPKELIAELEEELGTVPTISRETYQAVERKVLNRMKLMANEGLINLVETNERMFSDGADNSRPSMAAMAEAHPTSVTPVPSENTQISHIRKAG